MDKFNSPTYRRARKAYTLQQTLEYFVSLLVTDVFLAKLLSGIGINDSLVGIISSFITLAFVIQLLTVFITSKNQNAKKMVLLFDTIGTACFGFLYLIPFLPVGKTAKTVLFTVAILTAYFCKYLIQNIYFKWANSYVSPGKRAGFSAVKEMISLFSGMLFTILMGYILDTFEAHNNLSGGFLFIAGAILILNICNFISLSLIKKPSPSEGADARPSPRIVFREIFGNKNFRSVIILTSLWDIARYFSIGFLGIFKTKDLLLSVSLVQVINIIANIARVLVTKPIGVYSDRTSFSKGFKVGLYFAAAAFFINIFTTKSTWFFIIVYTILFNCSTAGTNQNSFNMVYSYVPSKYISEAMAVKNCIGGLLGFGASVLGGKLLDIVQSHHNVVLGVHVYGQQILSAISFFLTGITIVFIRKVVEKQKILMQ